MVAKTHTTTTTFQTPTKTRSSVCGGGDWCSGARLVERSGNPGNDLIMMDDGCGGWKEGEEGSEMGWGGGGGV